MNDNHRMLVRKPGLVIKAGSEVIRTWKRDGTTNTMGLGVAAYNLLNFFPDRSVQQIADDLVRGKSFSTPCAIFQIKGEGLA